MLGQRMINCDKRIQVADGQLENMTSDFLVSEVKDRSH
jgi:hypothetical protein